MLTYRRRSLGGGARAPVNVGVPAIAGFPNISQTLSVSNGTWSNSPVTFAYQWTLDGAPINGQTSSTYAVQTSDKTHVIGCTVTAANNGGSTSANAGMQYNAEGALGTAGVTILGTLAMRDTFTDTDGTLLTAHTADSPAATYAVSPGTPWVSNFKIDANGQAFMIGDAQILASFAPSSADYDIEFDMNFIAKATTSFNIGVCYRASNSVDTSYGLIWNANTGASTFLIVKRVAGTQTALGIAWVQNPPNGHTHHILVRVRGTSPTTVTVYYDDPTLAATKTYVIDSSSPVTAAGEIGVRAGGTSVSTATTGVHLDNLRVSYA